MFRHRHWSRRQILRAVSGAALATLGSGARILLDASPAGAQEDLDIGCCALSFNPSQWCPFLCREAGMSLRCWTCNSGSCQCCECTNFELDTDACFVGQPYACSYKAGCC